MERPILTTSLKVSKVFLFFFFLCLLSVNASALIYEPSDDIPILHTIAEEGLSSGITANITVRNPNGTVIVPFSEMNYLPESNQFNYTIRGSLTSQEGDYSYDICAYGSTVSECNTFDFRVTTTGTELSTSGGILQAGLIVALLFIFILTIWGALHVRWADPRTQEGEMITASGFKYFKIVLFALAWLELLFLFSIGNDLATSFLYLQSTAQFFRIGYFIMLSATAPLAIAMVYFAIVSVLFDKKNLRAIERGIPVRR